MIPIEGPAHSTNLTDGCWDCECETDYIHARIRESKCEKCGVTEEDGPDSHAHEAAEIKSLRMTAKEAMEYVGMCPFCHHSEVDEDGDGECTCEACGKGWKAERRIVGYSWTDEPEGRIKEIEQERDRLRTIGPGEVVVSEKELNVLLILERYARKHGTESIDYAIEALDTIRSQKGGAA